MLELVFLKWATPSDPEAPDAEIQDNYFNEHFEVHNVSFNNLVGNWKIHTIQNVGKATILNLWFIIKYSYFSKKAREWKFRHFRTTYLNIPICLI